MPLLHRPLPVVVQNGVDYAQPWTKLGPLDWLLPLTPGGTAYCSIFRTVSRDSPNSFATAR